MHVLLIIHVYISIMNNTCIYIYMYREKERYTYTVYIITYHIIYVSSVE